MDAANEFGKLLEVADRLLGPGGCQWDHKQTFESLRVYLLEEAAETVEAIDEKDPINLKEELGDLLYIIVFITKIAEKNGLFRMEEVLDLIRKKMIGRHPHIFENNADLEPDAVEKQWDKIKKKEKAHRESALDGIPKTLGALARAQKVSSRMEKSGYPYQDENFSFSNDEELGELLFSLVHYAKKHKLHAELALGKKLQQEEKRFREWETHQK